MLSFMGGFHGRTLGKTSRGAPPPLPPRTAALSCHLTLVPEKCFIFLSLLFSSGEGVGLLKVCLPSHTSTGTEYLSGSGN